jgi:hypothetical protein
MRAFPGVHFHSNSAPHRCSQWNRRPKGAAGVSDFVAVKWPAYRTQRSVILLRMKICILGNSVSLRMRPARNISTDLTYSEILEARGHSVKNVSKAGVMLNEAFAYLDDEVISFFPDLVIIHFGVVEVSYRQTVRWLNNFVIQNYYLNRVFSRSFRLDSLSWRFASLFIRAANFVTHRVASFFEFKWQWFPTKDFLAVLRSTIDVILKETGATVFLVGISHRGLRVEKTLQGSAEEITAANEIVQRLSPSYGRRVQYLDPNRFLQLGAADDLIPDGVHFSARGHRLMADEILAAISLLPEGKEVPATRESTTCHVQLRANSQS